MLNCIAGLSSSLSHVENSLHQDFLESSFKEVDVGVESLVLILVTMASYHPETVDAEDTLILQWNIDNPQQVCMH